MKTLIAIPCMDSTYIGFQKALINLKMPAGTAQCFKPNSLVYDSRNLLSLTAIEKGFDRVFWLDSDMTFPEETLVYMSERMDKLQCDMLTGIYFKRHEPYSPVIYKRVDPPDKSGSTFVKNINEYIDFPTDVQEFQVEGCGFGCVLTTTSLLKKVWDKFGPAFTPYPWAGEDVSFCYRVKQLGIPIYCDPSIPLGHIGTHTYTIDDFLRYHHKAGDNI